MHSIVKFCLSNKPTFEFLELAFGLFRENKGF